MNRSRQAVVLAGFLAMFMGYSATAWALTTLRGKEALDRLGDPRTHFAGGSYTAEILKRSHRDSMHGRFSDGVLFNADGGAFSYLRRKDGDHRILLDAPDGRQEEAVTPEFWQKEIQNTLSDDNPEPVVFLADQGKELAVLYVGRGTNINAKISESGWLEIEIKVDGAKDTSGRRRRGL